MVLCKVGTWVLQWFNGQAVNLVAKGSAVTQQELLTQLCRWAQGCCSGSMGKL